ncbi:hypothetical protein SAMN04489761_3822 [Tenacibaculum sp. MAR_2009_124]|uniref:hypothetical protein n=1 Tax=Tenacibaculum sp. MAR_2009_124 TaxID=1250059 RepID=UPI000896EAE3|nr:hypothetical protein [Tenacibaculum sp. MAR_2009_124]SEC86971.1 hypothetical protein SAMN04489761_3822 [Tenacibaculum sp. MAR_2009_124]
MSQVTQFHNLSHIFISLIGAVLLLAIYYNIRKRFRSVLEEGNSIKRVDRGLLFFSCGMLVWVFSGTWALLGNYFSFENTLIYQVGVNIFSTINNLFWLLALYYMYYSPQFIYRNEKNVKIISVIIAVVFALTLLLSISLRNEVYVGIKLMGVPDFLLTTFLCYLMAISFYRTFMFRGLKLVALISIVIVFLLFASQLSDVFVEWGNEFLNQLIRIITKTSLVCLFLVLATSWVIQLANTPRPNEMKIKFLDWSLIELTIPSKGIITEKIDFGAKTTQYKNLLDFGIRRKFNHATEQCIEVRYGGEIKSQTYITRIIDNINTILQLNEENRLERKDLITFVGDSKYRLRILPENISIDEALVIEFDESI